MNSCQFVGRMGKDPKFYQGQGDKKSCIMFSLAVKRAFAPQGQPDTDWLDFKAYGKTAEIINQYVPQGRQLAVNAHAVVEEWEDKQNGNAKRKAVKFYVDSCTLVGGKADGNNNAGGSSNYSNNNSTSSYTPQIPEDDDDDLPF